MGLFGWLLSHNRFRYQVKQRFGSRRKEGFVILDLLDVLVMSSVFPPKILAAEVGEGGVARKEDLRLRNKCVFLGLLPYVDLFTCTERVGAYRTPVLDDDCTNVCMD